MRSLCWMLAAVAIAAPVAARDRSAPAATPAGPAIDCVRPDEIRETRVRDDRTIDFVMRGGKVYRNVLPYACPELGFEERFAYTVSNNQLCSVDIITVLRSSGDRGAGCGLGHFQPVSLAK